MPSTRRVLTVFTPHDIMPSVPPRERILYTASHCYKTVGTGKYAGVSYPGAPLLHMPPFYGFERLINSISIESIIHFQSNTRKVIRLHE